MRFRRIVLERWLPPLVLVFAAMLLVFFLVMSARQLSLFQRLELQVYDLLLQQRHEPAAPGAGIDIVGIDEGDIAAFDYPLPDGQLADLLERLLLRGPSAIGLDLYRDLPVPRRKDPEQSAALQKVLRAHEEIITIFYPANLERAEIGIPAPYVLDNLDDEERPWRIATNDFPSERAVVRRAFLKRGVRQRGESKLTGFLSLGARLALLHIPYEARARHLPPMSDDRVRLGDEDAQLGSASFHSLHEDDGGYHHAGDGGFQFLLDFRGRSRFREVNLRQLMANDLPKDFGRDRVVLIGAVAPSLKDGVTTPFESFCPGVALHAQVVDQLVRAALDGAGPTRALPARFHMPWTLLWTILGGSTALMLFRWPRTAGLGLAAGVSLLSLTGVLAFHAGWWIPLGEPATAYAGAAGLSLLVFVGWQNRQERQLEQLFKQQVGLPIFEAIQEQRERFLEGGRPLPLKLISTVLFSDFSGFASVTEQLEPTELIAWLNEGMDGLARKVEHHGGLLKQFVGDSIMAVFGAPIPRSGAQIAADAVNAVRCALAMSAELERLNERWRVANRPQVGMRIGIFTGEVVTGGVGSDARMDFVILGRTVNMASRLESFGKDEILPPTGRCCRILLGEPTYLLVRDFFEVEPARPLHLKGKQDEVLVYLVLRETSVSPGLPAVMSSHSVR